MQETPYKYLALKIARLLTQWINAFINAQYPPMTDEQYLKKLCRIRDVDTKELFRIISKDAGFDFADRHLNEYEKRYLWHDEIPVFVEDFIRKNKDHIDEIEI
jgi:hypothetical protein